MILYKGKVIFHMPKCAGTSIQTKIKKDFKNVHYMSAHDNYSVLNGENLKYALEWDQYLLVRNPYSWYESWYNYVTSAHERHRHDALSAFLVFDGEKQTTIHNFVKRATNLKWAFRNDKLDKFRQNLMNRPNGYLKHYFSDLTKIDFQGTFMQFFFNAFYRPHTKVYKMETELDKFLKDTEVGEIGHNNKHSHKSRLNDKDKARIAEADKIIFDKFNYEI
jgi:hypothetical protein